MIEWFEESARLQALAAEEVRSAEPRTVFHRINRGKLISAYQNKVVELMAEAQRLRDSSQEAR